MRFCNTDRKDEPFAVRLKRLEKERAKVVGKNDMLTKLYDNIIAVTKASGHICGLQLKCEVCGKTLAEAMKSL